MPGRFVTVVAPAVASLFVPLRASASALPFHDGLLDGVLRTLTPSGGQLVVRHEYTLGTDFFPAVPLSFLDPLSPITGVPSWWRTMLRGRSPKSGSCPIRISSRRPHSPRAGPRGAQCPSPAAKSITISGVPSRITNRLPVRAATATWRTSSRPMVRQRCALQRQRPSDAVWHRRWRA